MNAQNTVTTLAKAGTYGAHNPPESVEIAETRIKEINQLLTMFSTETRNARRSMFSDDRSFRTYMDERTTAMVACKLERTFLFGLIATIKQKAEQEKQEAHIAASPEVAAHVVALQKRAVALLETKIEPQGELKTPEQVTARRNFLVAQKQEVEILFSQAKMLKETWDGFVFEEKPALKALLFQISREMSIARQASAKVAYTIRCTQNNRPELNMSLRQAIQFLIAILELHPPDLSSDLRAQQTLNEITLWARDGKTEQSLNWP